MICKHEYWTFSTNRPHNHCLCHSCGKTKREIDLEEALSEVLSVFRDEDVTITEEMRER